MKRVKEKPFDFTWKEQKKNLFEYFQGNFNCLDHNIFFVIQFHWTSYLIQKGFSTYCLYFLLFKVIPKINL